VQVNGLDRPLLRADLVLRSVALEAGEHTVRFHYSDPAVRAGLTGSLLGGILTLVLILFPLFRRFGRKIPAEGLMDSVEKVDSDD
jgi:flagellar biogenesis protein FliO